MSKHGNDQDHWPAIINNQPSSDGKIHEKNLTHRQLVKTLTQQGRTDELAIIDIQTESYRATQDSIKTYVDIFGSAAKPNLYCSMNRQIAAKCQIKGLNDPTATRRQRIAVLTMLEDIVEAHTEGLQRGLDKDQIKKLRNERLTRTALFHGLGTKTDLKLAKNNAIT